MYFSLLWRFLRFQNISKHTCTLCVIRSSAPIFISINKYICFCYLLKEFSHVLYRGHAFWSCFLSDFQAKGGRVAFPPQHQLPPPHAPRSGRTPCALPITQRGTLRHRLLLPSFWSSFLLLQVHTSWPTQQEGGFSLCLKKKNVPVSVEMICSSARLKLTEWDYGLCLCQACCHCSKWRGSPEREELPERRCVWRWVPLNLTLDLLTPAFTFSRVRANTCSVWGWGVVLVKGWWDLARNQGRSFTWGSFCSNLYIEDSEECYGGFIQKLTLKSSFK